MRPKKLLLLTITLVVCAAVAVAAASSGAFGPTAAGQEAAAPPGDAAREAAAADRAEYVEPAALLPPLRGALRVMGDRLAGPGKERLMLAGTLTLDGESRPFTLVSEFPGKLRLELAGGGGRRVIVFNERAEGRAAAEGRDADLIETLAFDSADHFFEGQGRGLGTRLIGTRFRADEAGTSFQDIYQVTETVEAGGAARHRSKTYFFNSDTLLLERVAYEDGRGAARVRVEIAFEWQEVEGQRVARRVTRTEGGSPVLSLDVTSAAVGPRRDDGIFIDAQGR